MFAVVKTKRCPTHIHGYLSRFMIEVDSNLFVATASKRVIENIWKKICSTEDKETSFIMIFSSNKTEQGYEILSHNNENEIIKMDDFYVIMKNKGSETA